MLLLLFFSQFLFLFIPSLFLIYHQKYITINKNSVNSYKFNKIDVIIIIGTIIFTQLIGILTSLAYEYLIPEHILQVIKELGGQEELMKMLSFENGNILIIILSICIGPAIAEEFMFRGYLQKNFTKLYSTKKSIILTSVVFSLIHLNVFGVFGIFLLSCVIGYYKEKTNSLLLPIIIHFTNNLFSVILSSYI